VLAVDVAMINHVRKPMAEVAISSPHKIYPTLGYRLFRMVPTYKLRSTKSIHYPQIKLNIPIRLMSAGIRGAEATDPPRKI